MNKLKELAPLVIAEADNLKKYATKEEIDRLDFSRLSTIDRNRCIYGQMTGDCYNDRANELIIQCATRVYETPNGSVNLSTATLNGNPYKISKLRYFSYHSPIEMFITYCRMDTDKDNLNNDLIDYIKGNISELKINIDE